MGAGSADGRLVNLHDLVNVRTAERLHRAAIFVRPNPCRWRLLGSLHARPIGGTLHRADSYGVIGANMSFTQLDSGNTLRLNRRVVLL